MGLSLKSQLTPHSSPEWVSYGVAIVIIFFYKTDYACYSGTAQYQ